MAIRRPISSASAGLGAAAVALTLLTGCTGPSSAPSAAPPPNVAEKSASAAAASPEQNAALQKIGFGSCLHQDDPRPIMEAVLARDFELFVFMGDNVYGDVESPDDLVELREAYARQAEADGFKALREQVPLLATWDDHDFGLNDAGATFPGRDGAEDLFNKFWDVPPDSVDAKRPGVYAAHTFGPPGRRVQVLLLDTRYFRSDLVKGELPEGLSGRYVPSNDPERTLLGDTQWKWLEDELRKPADLRLLVSSTQILAEGHGFEAWRTLPLERERLYSILHKTRANGVIVLSGDRHRAGIYKREAIIGYPLYEITSSSLNRPSSSPEEPGPHRLGPTYRPENFGAIHIDWTAGTVGLEIADIDGETVLREDLSIGRLRVSDGRD
ncbi:MAG: alkaline phosphatase D family protein [Acidobacteriota bacterium]